jgi:predicted DNA-binding transcriptional regulator AlpA
MITRLLRFAVLKELGIVGNWPALTRLIKFHDFPVGIKIGENTRAWREIDIEHWLCSRPSDRKALSRPLAEANRKRQERAKREKAEGKKTEGKKHETAA